MLIRGSVGRAQRREADGIRGARLPPGYRLDRSDPDVWALRRPLRIIAFDLAAFRGARVAVGWTHAELSWAQHGLFGGSADLASRFTPTSCSGQLVANNLLYEKLIAEWEEGLIYKRARLTEIRAASLEAGEQSGDRQRRRSSLASTAHGTIQA